MLLVNCSANALAIPEKVLDRSFARLGPGLVSHTVCLINFLSIILVGTIFGRFLSQMQVALLSGCPCCHG